MPDRPPEAEGCLRAEYRLSERVGGKEEEEVLLDIIADEIIDERI